MHRRFQKALLSLALTGVLVGGSAAIANAATSKSGTTTTPKSSTMPKSSTTPTTPNKSSGNCPNM